MQKDYRDLTPDQLDEGEKQLVDSWLKAIKERRESPEYARLLKKIPVWRSYVRGRQYDEHQKTNDSNLAKKEDIVRANLIATEMNNAIARVYARNPEISITPTEAVEPTRYEKIRRFGLTLQLVLKSQFAPNQAKLKKRAKSNLRSAFTTSMGVLKVMYQKDKAEDPQIKSRLNDIQDNIERTNSLIADLEDEEQIQKHEGIAEQLKIEMDALNEQLEVVRNEGLVIDRVLTENHTMSGDVTDAESYADADWHDEIIPMTVAECKAKFKFCPESADRYSRKGAKAKKDSNDEGLDVYIHETWHKGGGVVYTFCEGYSGYMREPRAPKRVGERWYPYFMNIPFAVDGDVIPNCWTEELIELQDEFNENASNLREHRKKNIPHWFGSKEMEPEDAEKVANPTPFGLELIDIPDGKSIRDILMESRGIAIDAMTYDNTGVLNTFERISGGQASTSRAASSKPKTLGEAEIIEGSLSTRMSEIQDTNEDMIQEIAQYSAEILLQEMTPQMVQKIAGPGAFWPEMKREEVFSMVQIEIMAGSTGKPNQQKEREVWTGFLPEFRETLVQVNQLRAEKQNDLADALIKLLEETLRRFDERIDIEEYFPSKEEGEEDQPSPEEIEQMMQQREQMKQQAELMDAQIAEIRSKVVKNLSEAEASEIGQQFDQYMEQMQFLTSLTSPAPGEARQLQ